MNISISSSRYGITGLVGTLASLLKSSQTPASHNITVICCDWTSKDKNGFKAALLSYGANIKLLDVSPKYTFGHLPGLFGDWSTYTRLLSPELSEGRELLHIDADLLIKFDVSALENFNFNGKAIAAVSSGAIIKYSNDRKFLTSACELTEEDCYFNAGVVLYNLERWRKEKTYQRILAFAEKHKDSIPVFDQSILNALFSKDFTELGWEYNFPWYPEARPSREKQVAAKIIHFVGSPKPWDPFGRFIHYGYKEWFDYTGGATFLSLKEKILRTYSIRRSIARTVLKRIKSRKQKSES